MQVCLCVLSALALLLMYWQLPETAHPGSRGFDRLIKSEQAANGRNDEDEEPEFRWVWLNPFASLKLLRAPNLLAVVSLSVHDILYSC
jgi:hypothetical protein